MARGSASKSYPAVSPLLSSHDITRLLLQPVAQCISDEYPWVSNDEALIDKHFKGVCAQVMRVTHTQSRIEWNHYGSGYASFIDAWFYKNTPDFNAKRPVHYGEEHTGLTVLLSRLSPYFVFMESEKQWDVHGGGYQALPELEMIDRLETPAVIALSQQIQSELEKCGLVRAYKEQLASLLPTGTRVPTVLTDRGFTQFDALFHWED
ncbi:hypothetical protein R0L47_07085 [Pectobacterium polonicum]|uniref:hypothetical protein n=1 Tax=Pectobacterium polonicum TaxID=2485124 RepID=UPI0010F66B47|nr:hypothetical protein [Pectobacterium polonicum]TKY83770.1 hypothetical protein EDI29_03375 [Pectobacterium polonicum]